MMKAGFLEGPWRENRAATAGPPSKGAAVRCRRGMNSAALLSMMAGLYTDVEQDTTYIAKYSLTEPCWRLGYRSCQGVVEVTRERAASRRGAPISDMSNSLMSTELS
jgi:hypothetical protein